MVLKKQKINKKEKRFVPIGIVLPSVLMPKIAKISDSQTQLITTEKNNASYTELFKTEDDATISEVDAYNSDISTQSATDYTDKGLQVQTEISKNKVTPLTPDIDYNLQKESTTKNNFIVSTIYDDEILKMRVLIPTIIKEKNFLNDTNKMSSPDAKININDCNMPHINNNKTGMYENEVRNVQQYLKFRNICFQKPTNFTQKIISELTNYSNAENSQENVRNGSYLIEFVTKDLINACQTLSNTTLKQLDKKVLKNLNAFAEIALGSKLLANTSAENALKQINKFIKCHKGKKYKQDQLVPEIKIEFIFDENLRFMMYETSIYLTNNNSCNSYVNMDTIYNQTTTLLPKNFISKLRIFNINSENNYKKGVFNLTRLFETKNTTNLTGCEVAKTLYDYNRQHILNNHSSVYKIDFENITAEETDVAKSSNKSLSISVIIICAVASIPLIIGLFIYCYCKKINQHLYRISESSEVYMEDKNDIKLHEI